MVGPKDTIRIYWQHALTYKRRFTFIYSAMAVTQILEDFIAPLLISWTLTQIAEGNIQAIDDYGLWMILAAILLLEFSGNLFWNVIIRVYWKAQELVMRDLAMTCFNHLETMSNRFFANRFAGSLVNQTNKFVSSFERLTDALTWNVYKLFVSLVATTIIIGVQSPIIAFAILFVTAVFAPIAWYYRQTQIPLTKRWAAAETNRTGQLADTVSNIVAVKSFSNEKLEQKRMLSKLDEVFDRSMETMKLNMKQEIVTGSLQRSINMVVIALSLYLAYNGKISIGLVYLSLTYTMAILRRLWDLNNTFRTLTRVFGDSHDMTEILQISPEVVDIAEPSKPRIIKPRIIRGAVDFKNVTFTHSESEKPLFKSLDLRIKPSEKIGLVGQSGGGKTTITQLLLRFMDIDKGSIEVDGFDIAKLKQADLRSKISYVPQEPLLFHRTIAENIAYGNPRASQKEIEAVAKMAHAHEFIAQLPAKYETLVGERGVKLSGGQRQRIAIARAMIKNAPILVLDEATSALDSESEVLIQDALWKLMEGKTAIIIAHRLSTIQKMDRIIVLDQGKIVEQGSHKELIRLNGTYAKLWSHQSGGFMED